MVKRVVHEPAFVLHRHAWSESSLILDVFTRHHGRLALVAKGVRRPHSSFRPVLLPLQPLQLSFGGDADVKTLKAADWMGGQVMPTGSALLSGFYANELLMLLLAREDAHPRLFDTYGDLVRLLATGQEALLEPSLRAFELLLMREVGLLPVLDAQTLNLEPLRSDHRYCLVGEGGLRQAHDEDRHALSGQQWQAVQKALDDASPFTALMHASADALAELKPQLRRLLHYHGGVSHLRTRQVMQDMQSL